MSVKLLEMLEAMLFRSPYPTLKVFESRVEAQFQRAFQKSIEDDYKDTHRVRRAFLDAVLKEATRRRGLEGDVRESAASIMVSEIMGTLEEQPTGGPGPAPPQSQSQAEAPPPSSQPRPGRQPSSSQPQVREAD